MRAGTDSATNTGTATSEIPMVTPTTPGDPEGGYVPRRGTEQAEGDVSEGDDDHRSLAPDLVGYPTADEGTHDLADDDRRGDGFHRGRGHPEIALEVQLSSADVGLVVAVDDPQVAAVIATMIADRGSGRLTVTSRFRGHGDLQSVADLSQIPCQWGLPS